MDIKQQLEFVAEVMKHVLLNGTVRLQTAVDPNVIPLGSKVRVTYPDGTIRTYDAIDVGGAVKGNHIDVFVDDRPLNERWFAKVEFQCKKK